MSAVFRIRMRTCAPWLLAALAACAAGPRVAPPPASPPSGLQVRLDEHRTSLGGRTPHVVEPLAAPGVAPNRRTGTVDPRSLLRLTFTSGDAAVVAPNADSLAVDAQRFQGLAAFVRATTASAREALGKRDAAALRGVRTEFERGATLRLAGEARAELERAVRDASAVERSADERVVVEAFRVTGRAQTALAVPGYNQIGSGRVANLSREGSPVDDTLRAAAHALLEQLAALVAAVDAAQNELVTADAAADVQRELAELQADCARLAAPFQRARGASVLELAYADLPPAEIDLAANGFARGDRVRVQVARESGARSVDASLREDASRDVVATWLADVTRIGWYRDESLLGIITRGDSGGAEGTNWELSFAGAVTWSWYQDEERWLGDVYAWLQPGFGIHLAALDQGLEDVEFGIGAHVSLWEGLLLLGAGTNLTVDGDVYYLIGGDLIGWKDKITGALR